MQRVLTNLNIEDIDLYPPVRDNPVLESNIGQSIVWLTGKTTNGFKLLRCNNTGALLTDRPQSGHIYNSLDVEHITAGTPSTFNIDNDCIAVSVYSYQMPILLNVYRVVGGDYYNLLVPANSEIYIPHKVAQLSITVFPLTSSTDTDIGIFSWFDR